MQAVALPQKAEHEATQKGEKAAMRVDSDNVQVLHVEQEELPQQALPQQPALPQLEAGPLQQELAQTF